MDEMNPDAEAGDAAIEAAEYDDLMGLTVEEILKEGQKALFARLVGKVRSGLASHQEAAILRNILKDNGMTLGLPPVRPQAGQTMDLPEFGKPDYE